MATSPPDSLLAVLEQAAGVVRAYLFGSWLRDPSTARDVDVALVYPDGQLSSAARIADHLRALEAEPDYDVMVLSETEEDELAFLDITNARRVWPP